MPYKCVKYQGKYKCVSTDTGKVHGTHASKSACQAQLRALYANAPPEKEK